MIHLKKNKIGNKNIMPIILFICLYFISLTPLWYFMLLIHIINICKGTTAIITEIITIASIIVIWSISFGIVTVKIKSVKKTNSQIFKLISAEKNSHFAVGNWTLYWILFLLPGYVTFWWGMLYFILIFVNVVFFSMKEHYINPGIFCVFLGYYVYRCEVTDENQVPIVATILSKKELAMWNNEPINCWKLNEHIWMEGIEYDGKMVS